MAKFILLASLALSATLCNSFTVNHRCNVAKHRCGQLYSNRRDFMNTSVRNVMGTVAISSIMAPKDAAIALPLVTVFEFEQILKDSGKNKQQKVEYDNLTYHEVGCILRLYLH